MNLEYWKPRKRTRKLPYGFTQDPDDKRMMLPDMEIASLVEQALDSLEAGISLREAADSLNARSTQKLTHAGLRILWDRIRPGHPLKQIHPKPKKQRMPRAERSKYRKRIKVAADKRRISAALKRIEKGEAELGRIKDKEEEVVQILTAPMVITSEVETIETERETIRPHPGPQTEFLMAPEQEVLYGGAAGGGKSYAMLLDPLRSVDNPQFFGVLLRRTNDELRKLINESQFVYKKIFGKRVRWMDQKSKWVFPSGAELWMTYLDNDRDLDRFQGQEYSWIGIDELTHYPTPYPWDYLRTRLRSTESAGLPTYMRATTNPGGPGHAWVKEMFIDPAPYNTPFVARNTETQEEMYIPEGDENFPREMWGKPMFYRRFIPAKLSDNPSLGWQYRANLMMQDDNTKRKLLDGDWSVAEGAAFSEFRVGIHTCKPFEIPHSWMRFRSCDYGYSNRQYSAIHWYAVDPNYGTLYVYREFYVNQLTGQQLQKKINEFEVNDRIAYGVLDSSLWATRGNTGPTIAEEMQRAGGRWRPSDRSQGSRVASKNRLHELLRIDPSTGKPGIIFFDTCRQIIKDLPMIPSAPPEQKEQDDIDQKYASDHAYDSIRYGIQTRPRGESGWDSWINAEKVFRPSDRTFGY